MMIVQTIPSRAEASPARGPHRCAVHLVAMPGFEHAAGPMAGRILALLCAQERARMATIRSAQAAWEYGCSHAALRLVVGRHLGVAPADVVLAEPGRAFVAPRLRTGDAAWDAARAGDRGGIHLSLSRSAPYAAIALGWHTRVGVDIERTAQAQTAFDSRSLFMSPAERQQLDARPAVDGRLRALRTWCLKEAVLKATGEGLSRDPREVALHPSGGDGRAFGAVFSDGRRPLHVQLVASDIGSAAVVALAHDLPGLAPRVTRESLEALLA